jgi:YspA, cpYpsA-related SLOG family
MTMRIAIVGSRQGAYGRQNEIEEFVASLEPGSVVVTGGAEGADTIGAAAARKRGLFVELHLADWTLGKAAGPMRNRELVKDCDKLVAFWDGKSRGTWNAISEAYRQGKPCEIRRPGNVAVQASLF